MAAHVLLFFPLIDGSVSSPESWLICNCFEQQRTVEGELYHIQDWPLRGLAASVLVSGCAEPLCKKSECPATETMSEVPGLRGEAPAEPGLPDAPAEGPDM